MNVPGSTATIMSTNSKAFSWLSSFKSSSSSFNIPRLSSQTHSRIQLTRFPKPFPWSILPISLVFTIILSSSLIGQLNGQSVLTQLLAPRIQNLLDSVLPERTPMIPTGGIMHPHRAKGRMRRPPPNPGALPYSSSLSMTRVRRPPLQLAHHRIPQSLSTSFHRQNGRGAMFLKGVDSSLNSLSFPSSGPLNLFTAESVQDYHPEYDHHPNHHQPLDAYSHHEEVAYNFHYNDHPPPYEHHHEEENSQYHETSSSGKPIHYEFHSVTDSDPNYSDQGGSGEMVSAPQFPGMEESYTKLTNAGTRGGGSEGRGQPKESEECNDEDGKKKMVRGEKERFQYEEKMLKPMMLPIPTNQDELGEVEGQKMMITKPSKYPFRGGHRKRPEHSRMLPQKERKYQQDGLKYYEEQFMQMMEYEHQKGTQGKYPKEQGVPVDQSSQYRQEHNYQETNQQNEQNSVTHGMYGMEMENTGKQSGEIGEEVDKPSSEEVTVSSSEFLDKNDKGSKEKYKTVTTSYFPYVQGADYKNQRSYNDDTMSLDDIDKYADIYKYNWNENEHLSMKSHHQEDDNHQLQSSTSPSSSPLPLISSGSYKSQTSPESSVIYSQPEEQSNPSYQGSSEESTEADVKENILEGATFLTSFRKEAPLTLHFNLTSETSPGIKANISINGYSIDPHQESEFFSKIESKTRLRGEGRGGRVTRRITRANSQDRLLKRKNDYDDNSHSPSLILNVSKLNSNNTKS